MLSTSLRLGVVALLAASTLSGCYWLRGGAQDKAPAAEQGAPSGYADAELGEFLALEPGAVERYVYLDQDGDEQASSLSRITRVETDADGRLRRAWFENETRDAGVDSPVQRTPGRAVLEDGRLTLYWGQGDRDVVLATPLEPGTTWRFTSGDLSTECRIVAVEDVCTPRGRFLNAIKVVSEESGSGELVRRERWYVHGVGEVMTTTRYADSAPEVGYMADHRFQAPSRRRFAPLRCED